MYRVSRTEIVESQHVFSLQFEEVTDREGIGGSAVMLQRIENNAKHASVAVLSRCCYDCER
jgi:hypothetical protein